MDRLAASARADLFLVEYGSLRKESAHAFESQHKIIEWTVLNYRPVEFVRS